MISLEKKIEDLMNENKALECEIEFFKKQAILEKKTAIENELKRISNCIALEFQTIVKFMNSNEIELNAKSSWNIFENEMKRIFKM